MSSVSPDTDIKVSASHPEFIFQEESVTIGNPLDDKVAVTVAPWKYVVTGQVEKGSGKVLNN